MSNSNLKVIGITGGIASGKTAVAQYLEQQGYTVWYADLIGHELLEHTDIKEALLKQFGSQILDEYQKVHRPTLGQIVFSNPEQMTHLNAIMHPAIAHEVQSRIQNLFPLPFKNTLFLEAAILLEAGWHKWCQEIWLVQTSPEVAIQRLIQRNGLTLEEAQQRLQAQWSNEQRRSYADVIFHNESSLQSLYDQVNSQL